MSRTISCGYKREPKNKSDFKGKYAFCGMTCCSLIGCAPGKGMRDFLRAHRNNQKKEAIREGMREYFCI